VESQHQSVLWTIPAPVSILENLHTSQCSGESPYQSVLWTIPTPIVLGNLHTGVPGNFHSSQCSRESPYQFIV